MDRRALAVGERLAHLLGIGESRAMSLWSDSEREAAGEGGDGRAPICPTCGVTALPADPSVVIDTRFVCENADCEAFGELLA